MASTPATFPISTASFRSDTYTFDPLVASETISQSANIAGSLGVLKRGTVLYGPAVGVPITQATLLTTATGAGAARCILAADIDTTGGQVTGVVYTQGKFLDTAMIFTSAGASSDVAQLRQFGVYVLTVEQRSGLLVPLMKLPATGGPLPQSLSPKDARTAYEEEVKSILAGIQTLRTQAVEPPEPPPPIGNQPPWAGAAFGEAKPTPLEKAKEKAAEEAGELADKQKLELDKLRLEFAEKLSELAGKQAKEREDQAEHAAEAIERATPPPPPVATLPPHTVVTPPAHQPHQPPPHTPPPSSKK